MLDNNSVELNLIPDIPESTKEELYNPSANLIGQAFRGIVHKVLDPLVRYNIVKDQELLDFTNQVQSRTGSIPIECRDNSKIGLALKAVEDSTYQLNSKILRELFANLIASTVDSRKNNQVLPSFSSVLKDLSSDDAVLLSELSKEKISPIVTIRIQSDGGLGADIHENIILLEDKILDNPISISSLERAGLISIDITSKLRSSTNMKRYEEFKKSSIYQKVESDLPFISSEIEFDKISLKEGKIALTPFGQHFVSVVI